MSVMFSKPTPLRTGPRIGVRVVPLASTRPPLAWPDSTLPMAASICQGRWQEARSRATSASAFLYASRRVAGMPCRSAPMTGEPVVGAPGGGFGETRGGRSV